MTTNHVRDDLAPPPARHDTPSASDPHPEPGNAGRSAALARTDEGRAGAATPTPVSEGASLLEEIHAALGRYVRLPSPEAYHAVALFIAATHAQPAWEHATRLVVKSPLKRCGKTRLQEVVGELSYDVLRTTNISPAALVRCINEDDPPTLVLDEADTVFGSRRGQRSESAEAIRGILNAGHARGWPYIRWDNAANKAELCPTFAMAVLGGIGDLPDTIEDRAVVVAMQRRAAGETVEALRRRKALPALHDLRDRVHAWIRGHLETLAVAEPALPVDDRVADVWEPIVAVADHAGGRWPDCARRASVAMTTSPDVAESTSGERLLDDLRTVFAASDRMSTEAVLERLRAIDEAPWSCFHGQPLAARGLADLLKPYGVKPKAMRIGAATLRGYDRADLIDAWRRYTSPPAQHP